MSFNESWGGWEPLQHISSWTRKKIIGKILHICGRTLVHSRIQYSVLLVFHRVWPCSMAICSTWIHRWEVNLQEGNSLIDGNGCLTLWGRLAKVQQVKDVGNPCCSWGWSKLINKHIHRICVLIYSNLLSDMWQWGCHLFWPESFEPSPSSMLNSGSLARLGNRRVLLERALPFGWEYFGSRYS